MPTINAINSKNPFVQLVSTTTGALTSATTVMPADNTIPQNTEGDEIFTLAITPKSASSNLEIIFSSSIAKGTTGSFQVALFQDSTASALAAESYTALANASSLHSTLSHIMTSGTTSSTTFKIRVGPSASTANVNGNSAAARIFGGVAATKFTIIEYL